MPEFGLAGAEIMCENLTYELLKLGHTVVIASMYDYHSAITKRMEKAGVDIRYLNKRPKLDFSMIGKLRRLFLQERPDVIHTHRYVMQYVIPAAILSGFNHVVHTVHNIAVKENSCIARKLNKIFYKYCDVQPIALSELIRESIIAEYGIKKDRIPIILNGVDLSKCIPKDNYSRSGKFKILHIGRFSEQKNHAGLLSAFKEFHESHPDSELWLVGDGEKKEESEKFVSDNQLADSVIFMGLKDDVHGILHDADMFVLPSNYEGIPMTLIEAMGVAMPIVATKVGGIPDMLIDEESALLCENKKKEIVEAVGRLYANEALRASLGNGAYCQARRFSALEMAQKYLVIYQEKNNK